MYEKGLFATVFMSVFLAELGDKTQLATMAYAADADDGRRRWVVFAAASLALVATSALGVLAGGVIGRWVEPRTLSLVAGAAFVAIGAWTIVKAW